MTNQFCISRLFVAPYQLLKKKKDPSASHQADGLKIRQPVPLSPVALWQHACGRLTEPLRVCLRALQAGWRRLRVRADKQNRRACFYLNVSLIQILPTLAFLLSWSRSLKRKRVTLVLMLWRMIEQTCRVADFLVCRPLRVYLKAGLIFFSDRTDLCRRCYINVSWSALRGQNV